MDRDFSVEAYTRLITAAIEGRLISYSDVAGRRMVGTYLYRIARYEKEHARPPLTAIVVHKQDGRPGEGFRTAMEQSGYAKPGETDDALWQRAVADVFRYWQPEARTMDSLVALVQDLATATPETLVNPWAVSEPELDRAGGAAARAANLLAYLGARPHPALLLVGEAAG